jgi:hypothetical protein
MDFIMSAYPSSNAVISWDTFMQQNQLLKDWTTNVRGKLKASAAQFTKGKKGTVQRKNKFGSVRDEEKLIDSIRQRIFYAQGIAEGASFRFERHGVFVHKGVGKGYKMVNGMVVRMGGGNSTGIGRKPVDWFNNIIDSNVPKLANDLASVNADAAVNAARMRIN